MLYPRTKLIEKFAELLLNSPHQYIAIVWALGVGKTTFLHLLQDNNIFSNYSVESLYITIDSPLESFTVDPSTSLIVIDSDIVLNISDIRTFIESKSPDSRVIFTSEHNIELPETENYTIDGISFREYAEWMGDIIDISSIMTEKKSTEKQNELRDTYIHLGQYWDNLEDPEHIHVTFESKLSIMNQELFKKEEWDFLEFIRTIAMNVGDIYKEERIAKNMNISRRKVRKYTELLLKHNMIRAVWPWVENPVTELSRHVKIYFSDLSYFHAALGVSYYHGEGKQWVIENFILLELSRKLSVTHDIRFYRKKSGAEVSFVLIEQSTNKITPIEVTTRSTNIIPQSLRIFYEAYSGRIEHAMMMNDSIAEQQNIGNIPVIILPHIAI